MPTDRGVKLLADIIVLNEITELLNSVNGSLSTSVSNVKSVVDTINTNVNTVKTATAVNNTASTTGTLSQKMSSAIANTATNNTASKTGILSQKLAYVISLLENSTYGLNALKSLYATPSLKNETYTNDAVTGSKYHSKFSYSGSGEIYYILISHDMNSSNWYGACKVIVDGVVFFSKSSKSDITMFSGQVPFTNSLEIQIANIGGGTASVNIVYGTK